jgi:hypothetical protein
MSVDSATSAVNLMQSANASTSSKLQLGVALAKQALDGDKTALQLMTVATDGAKGQKVDTIA